MISRSHPLQMARAALLAGLLVLLGVVPAFAQDVTAQATPEATVASAVTTYHDPAGRFTVEVPAGWTDQSTDSTGVFADSHGIKVYLLSIEAQDAATGITAALAQVAPDVTDKPAQTTTVPAPNGIFTQQIYSGNYGLVFALAQAKEGRVYVEVFRVRDQSAIQAAGQDINTIVLGLTIGAALDLSGQQPAALTQDQLKDFADYIQAQMTRYQIKGASVAIVQNGKIIFAQGFGQRSLDGPAVDADTLFMIGSTSKSMTTMMMGTLVDDGKLDWNTPVTRLLPSLALSDANRTTQIRVRDLMNNASGVPRYDMPLLFERQTPDQIIASLKSIPLVSGFGEKFNYSNQMVSTGGFIAAIAAGATVEAGGNDLYNTYAELMQQRVFDPIGMSRTTLDFDQAEADANHASSYVRDELTKQLVAVAPNFEQFAVPVAPAGAIWSSANDMARYMQTELSGGVAPDGTRVVSTHNLHETQTPGVTIAGKLRYGMGWMIGDYHGQTLIEHGGNTVGYTSDFGFLPDANLGVLVLSNVGLTNNFGGSVREYAFEQAFGIQHEADTFYWESQKALQSLTDSLMGQYTLEAQAPDAAKDLLGSYEGNLSVVMDDSGKQLVIRAPFGDVPLFAVKDKDGLYFTGGATQGIAAQFGKDADGTVTMTVNSAINLGEIAPPKTYKKLS